MLRDLDDVEISPGDVAYTFDGVTTLARTHVQDPIKMVRNAGKIQAPELYQEGTDRLLCSETIAFDAAGKLIVRYLDRALSLIVLHSGVSR